MAECKIIAESVVWQKRRHGAIVQTTLIEEGMPGGETLKIQIPNHGVFDDLLQHCQWWCIKGEEGQYHGNLQIGVTGAA